MPLALSPRTSAQRNSQLQYCVGWVKRRAALYFDFLQQHSPKERAFLLMGFVEKGNPDEPTLVDITCLSANDLKQNDPPIRPLEQAVEAYNMQNEFVAWIVLEREDRSARCDPIFTHVLTVALSDVGQTPPPPAPTKAEEEKPQWHRRTSRTDEGRLRQIEFETAMAGMQNELERRLSLVECQLQTEHSITIRELRDRVASLEGALAAATAENKMSHDRCNERVSDLGASVTQYRTEVSTISSGVVSEIKAMTEKIKFSEQLLQESRASQKHIETRQNQLLKDFGEARVGENERDRRVERLCESMDSVRVEVHAFREQMRKMDKRCAASESAFDSLVPQVKKIDEVIGLISDQHDSQIKSVEESIRSASEKFEAEIPAQAILLESLQSSVERTMSALKKDLDSLHEWKREESEFRESQSQREDDVNHKLNQIESQLTDHANVFSQVEHLAQAALRSTQELHCSSMNVKQEIELNRQAVTTLDKGVHSLEERLNLAKRELLESIRSSHSIVKKEKDMELDTIKGEMRKASSSIESLRSFEENSHSEIAEVRQAVECVRELLRDHAARVSELATQQESFSVVSETVEQLARTSEAPLQAYQHLSDAHAQLQQTQHTHYQALAVLQQRHEESAGQVIQLRHGVDMQMAVLQESINEQLESVKQLKVEMDRCMLSCERRDESVMLAEIHASISQFGVRVEKLEGKVIEIGRWQSQSSSKCDTETIAKVQDFVNSEIQNFVAHLNEAMSKLDVTGLTTRVVDLQKRFENLGSALKQDLADSQWQLNKQLQDCRKDADDIKSFTKIELQNMNERIGAHLNEMQAALFRPYDAHSNSSAPTLPSQYQQAIPSAPPTPTREFSAQHLNGKAMTHLPVYHSPAALPLPVFQPPPLPSSEPNIPPMLPPHAVQQGLAPPTPPPVHLSLLNQLPMYSNPTGSQATAENVYRPRTPISNAALDISKSPRQKQAPGPHQAPNPPTPRRASATPHTAHTALAPRDELYTSLIPTSMRDEVQQPSDQQFTRPVNTEMKAAPSITAPTPLPGRSLYQLHSDAQNGPSAFRTTLPSSLPSPAFTPYERVHQNGHGGYLATEGVHSAEKKTLMTSAAEFRNYEPPPRAVLNTSRTA